MEVVFRHISADRDIRSIVAAWVFVLDVRAVGSACKGRRIAFSGWCNKAILEVVVLRNITANSDIRSIVAARVFVRDVRAVGSACKSRHIAFWRTIGFINLL